MKVQVCPKGKMKKFLATLAGALVLAPALAHATPSTTFWAPSTPYIQPYGLLHITYDTYFSSSALLPVDTGLEIGVLPMDKFQMEAGFDFLLPTPDPATLGGTGTPAGLAFPILFNAKVGSPENAFGEWSPGWSAGIYNIGIESDVTNYNIAHFMLGKTIAGFNPEIGFSYALNDTLVAKDQFGLMVGLFLPPIEVKKDYMDKVIFAADVQTGKNGLGAAGGGVYLYFTPTISLLTGPVFFLEKNAQAGYAIWLDPADPDGDGPQADPAAAQAKAPGMVWTMQLDIDMDLFTKKAE